MVEALRQELIPVATAAQAVVVQRMAPTRVVPVPAGKVITAGRERWARTIPQVAAAVRARWVRMVMAQTLLQVVPVCPHRSVDLLLITVVAVVAAHMV